jgi:alpha-L-fucosidase
LSALLPDALAMSLSTRMPYRLHYLSGLLLLTLLRFPQLSPASEQADSRDSRLQWFRDARFGMFIHWGLYSVAAGQWDGKTTSGASEWIMNDLQIPASKYQQLLSQFNPEKFNALEWVQLAKEAGMKYIVITTKHHDGFALYPSRITDWSVRSTPFHRDPLKELATACKQQGIRLCFYHSIMDWHHPDYSPRKSWNDLSHQTPNMDRYVNFLKAQVNELLTDYGPISLLWFDGQWENTWTYERGADLYNYVRSLQPDILVNNRVNTDLPLQPGQVPVGDYKTPEQHIPSNSGPTFNGDWETCMTMNNTWGFKTADHDWKSSQLLVRNLIDCASKGGNYLLNVGPTGDGLIPQPSIDRLKEIGHWLNLNGSAIYGTSAGPFARPLPWGRVTMKGSGNRTTLYLHVFDWPRDGELLVPGLKTPAEAASLLSDPGKNLITRPVENGLVVELPGPPPDAISSTIVLHLTEPPDIEPAPAIIQARDGSVRLDAAQARLHGNTLQYESGGQLGNIGYWTTPDDWADWEFKILQPGSFLVSATIAAPASGDFQLSVAGQTLRCSAPNTGNYVTFASVKLGVLKIPARGKTVLSIRPIKEGWQPMNLKAILLQPARGQI